jgi:hypothetical protein
VVELLEPATLPIEPDGLTKGGRVVWLDLVPHCAGRLATSRDSMLLGQLANLVAACNEAWISGSAPPAAFLSEVRRMAELFGLAGPRSRLVAAATGSPPNPFKNNGRRPSRDDG